jgi:hypothetical protein
MGRHRPIAGQEDNQVAYARKFYTSDTHFGHRLMIGDTLARPRPWASTDEMDEALIANWNAVVRPDDIVYHLGDFAFQLETAPTAGGHLRTADGPEAADHRQPRPRKDELHPTWRLPWDTRPQRHRRHERRGSTRSCCVTTRMRVWPGSHRGAWHFYGHSHGDLPGIGRSRDIGVDMPDTGFAPRTFRELTSHIKENAEW